jgi:hypothetical protein
VDIERTSAAEVDAIIFGTGFRTLDVLSLVQVVGARWREPPRGVAEATTTVFATGCKGWYVDKGESPVLWPGFTLEYWYKSRRLAIGDFARG